MMHKRYFLLPLLLLAASGAWACYDGAGSGRCGPYGLPPGSGAYVPPPSYTPQIYEPPQIYVPPPPAVYNMMSNPPPIRESRYGAVAVYFTNSLWDSRKMFASVHGINSAQRARQMALQACNRKSGRTCKIYFDYANQCASVVIGQSSKGLEAFPGLSTQRGQAALDAMQKCEAANAKDCEFVMVEECSLPIY
ncbi:MULTISPECIES: DUF4189 domain-containing protein [unclassified Eikenella]|uniref:DUF4189 domain-containing protein n=1 Tax=unclassified Eikenella TaxID=2639367 RepID=UPI0009F3C221|nr:MULTISPECIES: DUF4189 domain-containing protein [unclassified Eikenella]